jgi:hypothetical protein
MLFSLKIIFLLYKNEQNDKYSKLLEEFDAFYKDFTSNFDLNFDLRSIYESLKQIQICNHINLISQLENGSVQLNKIQF